MATPKEIPSKVNSAATKVTAAPGNRLYITAILRAASTLSVTIKGASIDCGSPGPVAFPSPIECSDFTPQKIGQIAYYEQ
jgi:hypothetical protein